MTTVKLIGLRIYNALIGRFAFGKNLLRYALEKLVITKNYRARYSPATKYFNHKYFE